MELTHARWVWVLPLALSLVLGCDRREDDVATLDSAKVYLQKRELPAAVIQLKNVLQGEPNSAEARFLLGKTLLELGDAAGAELELRRAKELGYADTAYVPPLAEALLKQGQQRKLLDEFAQVELSDRQAAGELQTTLGLAYATQGAPDKAEAAAAKALTLAPDHAPARVLDARLKARAGDLDGALRVLTTLLDRSPNDIDALRLKGDLLLQSKGDVKGAIAAYRKAVDLRGNQPAVRNALLTLYLMQHDLESARKELIDLKRLQPKHPQTRYFEAQLAYADGKFKEAREHVQEALRLVPGDVRYQHLAGAVELQLGDLVAARNLLESALQTAPKFGDARRLLAQVYVQLRQGAKALATLQPILDAGKPSAAILKLAAQGELLNGNKKAAQALLARAAQLKPDDKPLSAAMALVQIGPGEGAEATGQLQKIAASDSGTSVDLALISTRIQRKEFNEALQAVDALERKKPDSAQAAELRARIQVLRGETAAARKSFEQSLARDANYLPAVSGIAGLDLQEGKFEAAVSRMEAYVEREPKNARAAATLAEIRRRSGAKPEDVTRTYADAIRANSANAPLRMAQIEYLMATRNGPAALAAAQSAVVAVPESAELQEALGRAQLSTGDQQQATTSFRKVVTLRPERAMGYIGLSTVYLAAQDLEAATREARKALELEPDSIAAQRLVVNLALRRDKPQEALALAQSLQKRLPGEARGYVMEGEIESSRKRWDPAISAFRKALSKPEPSQAAARLHTTLVAAQRAPEAAKFAQAWLTDNPKDAAFLLYLGDVALAQGALSLAEVRYQQVARLQPNNAIAPNNIAWLLMQQKKPGALEHAERAVKLAPDQPTFRDTLAMVLSADKQHSRAVEVEKQVVEQAPNVAAYRLTLAKIYLQAGDKDSARQELERLAKLGDGFRGQEEVTNLLKSIGPT